MYHIIEIQSYNHKDEATGQWSAKALDDEIRAINLASCILAPQFDIGLPIGDGKVFKALEIAAQLQIVEQFGQR